MWAWKRRRTLRRKKLGLPRGGATAVASDADNGRVSLKRLPSAVLAAVRIPAFRWRIPYVSMTILELFLTIGFSVGILVWDFVHCAPSINSPFLTLTDDLYSCSARQKS